jgi:hypothetical protein
MNAVMQKVEESNYDNKGELAGDKTYSVFGKDKGLMDRDFCIGVHKKLHEIGLTYMLNLKTLKKDLLN